MKNKHPFYSNRKLLICLILFIFILQALGFLLYENISHTNQTAISKKLLFQHTILLVQQLRESNATQQKTIINTLNNSAIQNSITLEPVWPMQINKQRLWQVHKLLLHQGSKLNFSQLLADKRWLNLSVNLNPSRSSVLIFILAVELAFFILIMLILWLLYRYSVPLQTIRNAANNIGVNIHSTPLQSSGPEAARETYTAINAMQHKIQQLLKERSLMLAAIAHDLKTPLTRMRLRTDFIVDKEQYQKNMADIDNLDAMIEQLIVYAKNESESEPLAIVDLNALLESLCFDYQDQKHAVSFKVPEAGILMHAHSSSLKRLCRNLIDNALKYAGSVVVTLKADTKNIQLLFEDDGPGIPDNEIEAVIQPFYRINKGRNQSIPGSGLGLAIANKIVQIYQGKLTICNRSPKGLLVKIDLPIR